MHEKSRGKPSIAKAVEEIVQESPIILECILKGIVNYSKLAKLLEEAVTERTGKASTAAIKMALVRLAEKIQRSYESTEEMVLNVFAKTTMSLQTDITVIVIERERVLPRLKEIIELLERARFFQILQGHRVFTLIVSSEDAKKIIDLIGAERAEVLEGQAAILLMSPKSIVETPGVIAYLTLILTLNGINITELVSCHNDTLIVVSTKDSIR
ncbi:MAG: ACT domain-containing protein, partial [Pyrodictiaceae archaeon]